MCKKHGNDTVINNIKAGWGIAEIKGCVVCAKKKTDELITHIETVTPQADNITGQWDFSDKQLRI